MEPQPPHEALSLVLSYLNLLELLSMKEVCRSFRFTVDDDLLLWLDIAIESPLNLRINNDILLDITSKAQGRLRSLALINCVRITDDGLQRVIEDNLLINKLYVPACTRLTPDGIVRIVKKLTDGSAQHNLRYLRLCGIPNLTKEHLQVLNSCLLQHKDASSSQVRKHYTLIDHNKQCSPLNDVENRIDVEICPKCENVSLVFDCPKESCVKNKNENPLRECRGCVICIPRCEGCGECTEQAEDEVQETVCSDVLCLNCWLKLPKCNLCNKPYCPRHADIFGAAVTASSGFVCDNELDTYKTMEKILLPFSKGNKDIDLTKLELYVPACTRLTPDGIVRIVKKLTDGSAQHNLRYLRLCGIPNLTKEHLQVLNSCLLQHNNASSSQLRKHHTLIDHNKQCSPLNDVDNRIDVEICPKCENVSLVFDCPKESCVKNKNENPLRECRGCVICIPRCEGCGECTEQAEDEVQETACSDVLCLNCWLKLPKCNLCNKPYCPRHADIFGAAVTASSGFICDVCMFEYQEV